MNLDIDGSIWTKTHFHAFLAAFMKNMIYDGAQKAKIHNSEATTDDDVGR